MPRYKSPKATPKNAVADHRHWFAHRARQAVLIGALAVLGLAAIFDLARISPSLLPWNQLLDFSDFYCAGAVLDSGADPYRYEPLHSCEHEVNVGTSLIATFFAQHPHLAAPAPQPPYDLAPLKALARLPFDTARSIAAVAIVAAVALCVVALAALGVPLEVAAASLALSAFWVELQNGQIVPFALLALVLCGLALARGYDALAGVLAVLTAIEPTVGLPVTLATIAFVPRARLTAGATVLSLVAVSLVVVGPVGLVNYFTEVLPAHAAAELHFLFQFSLSSVLANAGLAPSAALLAGTISYLAFLAVGLLVAPRVSNALQRRELLVFLPALCALIGGTFLHEEELCVAIPAVAILMINTQGWTRAVCASALCALSIPWIRVWTNPHLILASIFVWGVILFRSRVDLRIGVAILGCMAAVIYAFRLQPPVLLLPSVWHAYAPNDLAQSSWRDFAENLSTTNDLSLWFAIKVPAWASLLAVLAVAAGCGRRVRTS